MQQSTLTSALSASIAFFHSQDPKTSGVLAFGAALVVNKVNHRYALEREALAAEERRCHELKVAQDKLESERLFIATELIFLLEQFAEG